MNHSAFYNPVWHTPVLPPIPQAVLDCHKPVSLWPTAKTACWFGQTAASQEESPICSDFCTRRSIWVTLAECRPSGAALFLAKKN